MGNGSTCVLLAEVRLDVKDGTATAYADFFNGRFTVIWDVPCQKRPDRGWILKIPADVNLAKIKRH